MNFLTKLNLLKLININFRNNNRLLIWGCIELYQFVPIQFQEQIHQYLLNYIEDKLLKVFYKNKRLHKQMDKHSGEKQLFLEATAKARIAFEQLQMTRYQIRLVQREEANHQRKGSEIRLRLKTEEENLKSYQMAANTNREQSDQKEKELAQMEEQIKKLKKEIGLKHGMYRQNTKEIQGLSGSYSFCEKGQHSGLAREIGEIQKQEDKINAIKSKLDEVELLILQLENEIQANIQMKDEKLNEKLMREKGLKEKLTKGYQNEKYKLFELQETKQILQKEGEALKLIIGQFQQRKSQIQENAKLLERSLDEGKQEEQKQLQIMNKSIKSKQLLMEQFEKQAEVKADEKQKLEQKKQETERVFKFLVKQLQIAKEQLQKKSMSPAQTQNFGKELSRVWKF